LLNPNGKIPVVVDHDAHGTSAVLSESAAIMLYLAEENGVLLPPGATARHAMMQWIMFQMSSLGPAFGQLHHFESSSERVPYALQRFEAESRRLLGVMDGRLAVSQWLAGTQYSIADVCTWPWIRSWQMTIKKDLNGFPNVLRWYEECVARAASKTAIKLYDALKAGAAV
jgi:GST-like protein